MNAKYSARASSLLSLFLIFSGLFVVAQDNVEKKVNTGDVPVASTTSKVALAETEMDLPGQFDSEFGMQPDSKLSKTLRPLSKIDLDGDMNYDGAINNNDSTDNGPRENVSPGLQLGVGELTKLVLRFKTYDNEYPGELFVTLRVSGINRFSRTGQFDAFEKERESVGRIRVWADKDGKELILDSGDADKSEHTWQVEKDNLKTGLPGALPRIFYVEGVEASKEYEGDVRLLVSSSHSLSSGENRPPSSIYRTAFDHILFTIVEKPVKKGFVNNNAEGVWSSVVKKEKPVAAQ